LFPSLLPLFVHQMNPSLIVFFLTSWCIYIVQYHFIYFWQQQTWWYRTPFCGDYMGWDNKQESSPQGIVQDIEQLLYD
jgi:hypothetical protein